MYQKVVGAKCPQCADGYFVQNPKTGKVFCDKKCWLNQDNVSSTAKPFISVERKSLKDEPEYKELVKELNDAKWAVHALWATLIQGDTDKERSYELHKVPLQKKSYDDIPVIGETPDSEDDLPF